MLTTYYYPSLREGVVVEVVRVDEINLVARAVLVVDQWDALIGQHRIRCWGDCLAKQGGAARSEQSSRGALEE